MNNKKFTKCYRCEDRVHITGLYPAQTDTYIVKNAQDFLKINTANPMGEKIACCIEHISPVSRKKLHEDNVFQRYEYQFLNYILYSIKNLSTIKLKSLNEQFPVNGKNRRYDLYLSDAKINGFPTVDIKLQKPLK